MPGFSWVKYCIHIMVICFCCIGMSLPKIKEDKCFCAVCQWELKWNGLIHYFLDIAFVGSVHAWKAITSLKRVSYRGKVKVFIQFRHNIKLATHFFSQLRYLGLPTDKQFEVLYFKVAAASVWRTLNCIFIYSAVAYTINAEMLLVSLWPLFHKNICPMTNAKGFFNLFWLFKALSDCFERLFNNWWK